MVYEICTTCTDQSDFSICYNYDLNMYNIYIYIYIIIYICRTSFRIYLSSISTICKFEQSMCMRYTLCYIERSGKEIYGDTRTKSGKATATTFYAIVCLAYHIDPVGVARADWGHTHQRATHATSMRAHSCSNWWPFPSPYSNACNEEFNNCKLSINLISTCRIINTQTTPPSSP